MHKFEVNLELCILQSICDIRSLNSSTTLNLDLGPGQTEDVKSALYKELKGLVLREKLVSNFSVSTFCSKLLVWHKPIIIIMIMSKFSRGYTRSYLTLLYSGIIYFFSTPDNAMASGFFCVWRLSITT